MSELALTPPGLHRFFQTIDLAPLPQDCAVAESLDAWRERRGADLAPPAEDMFRDQTRSVLDHSFLAGPLAGTRDFAIAEAGSDARRVLDLQGSGTRLLQLRDRRLAARLRQLFRLVLGYGEPVDVRFVQGQRGYEVLAAPVKANGKTELFCTVTYDQLPNGSIKR